MTYADYHAWAFRPKRRNVDQQLRWWKACYVPGPADYQLLDLNGWTLIIGGPGSGKSVALSAWLEQQPDTSLVVDYPPDRWPGGSRAWMPSELRHLPQMLATALMVLYVYLEENPHLAPNLGSSQRVHLRAMIEQIGGGSLYDQLVDRLASEDQPAYQSVEVPEHLREPAQTQRDIELSLKNFMWLAKGLGLNRVILTFDLERQSPPETHAQLAELLRGLDVISNNEFLVVAAVPESALTERRPVSLARSRVSVVTPIWVEEQCHDIAARHICLALNTGVDHFNLEEFAAPELLQKAGALIQKEYGFPSPTGWVDLAETLLYLTHRALGKEKLPKPVPGTKTQQVIRTYYFRHMPLRLDVESHGVWRGPRFIRLDDQPLNLLALLEQRRRPVNWDDEGMQYLAGSKENVHSIVRRARKAIEPYPSQPVYLVHDRGGGGYRLEKSLDWLP